MDPGKTEVLLVEKQTNEKNENIQDLQIKATKRRWIILCIFILYGAINSFQWIEYAIISNVVTKYYNVSAMAVDWTSIIYMALYPVFVIPASYIIDKKGLRAAALWGGLGTAIGTGIKVFSIRQDLFYVVIIGQAIESASQLFLLPLPPRLASVWFKADEVSTACSLGVFGTQLGCAIGFVLPPIIVRNHKIVENIGADLKILCWGLTIIMIPVAIAILFSFPAEPKHPPNNSIAQERLNKQKVTMSVFFKSIKDLYVNRGFLIHKAGYSLNIAVFSAIGTLLNQYVLFYFEGAQEDAGRMGLVLVLCGMVGSITVGIYLDKTHKYKFTVIFLFFMSAVGVVILMFALEYRSKLLVYMVMGLVGFFTNAYMPAGFELAMELTYPSPESTTTGILIASTQLLGVVDTIIAGKLIYAYGPFWSLASQAALLVLGTIITVFVPDDMRRQEALKENVFGKNKELQNDVKCDYSYIENKE